MSYLPQQAVATGADDKPRMPVTVVDCGQIGQRVEEEEPSREGVEAGEEGETKAEEEVDEVEEEKGAAEGQAELEEVDEVPEIPEEELSKMSSHQRRLFELRLKINQGRKLNRQAVKDEHSRLTNPGLAAKERQEERKKEQEKWKKDMQVSMSSFQRLIASTHAVG